jgi:hypothetical protein
VQPRPPEAVDLTEVNDDMQLEKWQEKQRLERSAEQLRNEQMRAAITAQEERDKGPQKIPNLQCVVCMDNLINITATHCGKLWTIF